MNAKVVTQLPAHIIGEVFFWSHDRRRRSERLVKIQSLNPSPGVVALAEIIDDKGPYPADPEVEVLESHDLTRAYVDWKDGGWSK